MMIAEGVSLFNIREIHILDFWYNISRNQQLIGRGIRQCSHKTLDFEHRNLTIYNYIAVTKNIFEDMVSYDSDSDKSKTIKYIKKQSEYPVDIRKLQLSHEKYEKILKIEHLIKQNSIDCLLNKNINNTTYNTFHISDEEEISSKIVFEIKNSKNDTKLINYSLNNDIKCINETFSEYTPNEIQNIYKFFINNNSIVNTKYYIKLIYRTTNKIYLDFDTIKKYINKIPIYSKYNEDNLNNLIRLSLHELIFNRELFYNKFNNKGFLVINGKYFIFKLFDTNEIELPYEILINPFKNKLKHIINFDKYSIKLSHMEKTTLVNTKTTRTKSSTKSKISVDNENLQSICIDKSINDLTKSKDFENLWTLIIFSGKKTKTHPKRLLPSPSPENLELSTIKNILNISSKTFNFSEKFINNIYNDFNIVLFIYNSLELIVNYLKCLFYTVHIKNEHLDKQNQVIYNYYKYLIINESEPLIFKFINFIKMLNIESYDYTNKSPLQTVYYQFDSKDNEWYTHDIIKDNYDIENIPVEIFSINLYVQKYKKKHEFVKTHISPNTDNKETHFMDIYNSFNYTHFNKKYEYNYFEYTGDYNSPYDSTEKSCKTTFLNIVGIIDIKPAKENDQITEKNLSKIVFTLGIIYFRFIKNDSYPVYYRGSLGSIIEGEINANHILYSVLDQVQEFNKLILFNSIFYNFNKEEIYIIWNLLTKDNIPFKFLLKDNLNYSFDENYNLQYELTQDIFANLCELMTKNLIDDNFTNTYKEIFEKKIFTKSWDDIKIDIIDKLDTISKLKLEDSINFINENQELMYKYIEEYKILIQNSKTPLTSSLLLSTLLYNLDTFKFYNKRWLLNLYESSFLTADILDLKFFTGKLKSTYRLYDKIANKTSLGETNTLILPRTLRS